MLATFTVTSNADSGAGIYTPGELRWAIDQSNITPGPDLIEFRLPTSATTIVLVDGLDAILDPVVIDGTTQPGYLTDPIVAIDGGAVSDVGIRLSALASGTTIKALSIYGFQYTATNPDSGNGILIDPSSDANEISACFIGTDAASTASLGNAVAGVLIRGTGTVLRGNVISGNGASGVIMENDDGTVLEGNRIGTDGEGNAALANAANGVLLLGSSNAVIGGTTAVQRNVISGNVRDGVRLSGASFTNIVGNFIGVDAATGAVAVANGAAGVSLDAIDTAIGDGTFGGRNVISGNDEQGILIRGGSGAMVAGNFIGVAASGLVGAGNVLEGIRIDGGFGHLIGGTVAGQGNVIGDNGGDGVRVTGEATDVLIQQNLIGLGITLAAVPNGGDGVSLLEASNVAVTFKNRIAFNQGAGVRLTMASGNFVGADASRPPDDQGLGFGNAIYANELDGIRLEAESNDNVVAANLVGLATPNGAIQGNGGDGIAIQASRRNVVGGVIGMPIFANIVAGNVDGISITNCDALDYAANGGDGNTVLGNEVRNNTGHGVVLDDAAFQLIGGFVAEGSNTITRNAANGIEIRNGSRSIAVAGNFVGTNSAGILGFGNGGAGIRVLQSNASLIGGLDGAESNLVVGNAADGIVITRVNDAGDQSGDARENGVFGNTVRANRGNGIRITSASDNTIGDSTLGFGNVVGNNGLDGLRIETNADGNRAFGNVFGGPSVLGNGGVGIRITASYENLIGLSADGAGNLVSRNLGGGMVIDRSRAVDLRNGNAIVGNVFDTNLGDGVRLIGSSFQTVGEFAGAGGVGNTITRNRGVGLRLIPDTTAAATPSDENLVQSNFIGTNSAAAVALGNSSHGIEVVRGSYNVFLGNTVSQNAGTGIRIDGGRTAGTTATVFGTNNVIGGGGDGEGNVVAGNSSGGILLENDARNNSILGGVVDGNKGSGVHVRGSAGTVIGGGVSIVRSTGDGVLVSVQQIGGPTFRSNDTVIEDAYIGTNSTNEILGNQGNGIRLSGRLTLDRQVDAALSVVGVTVGSGVVAAFNRFAGVRIENSTAASPDDGNIVRGSTLRNNSTHGIVVSSSSLQRIGGITDGFGNEISANGIDGIALINASRLITIRANEVFQNGRHGISLATTNDSTIDGANVITKNGSDGINVGTSSARNVIADNTIGDEADPALGNKRDGLGLYAVNNNTVTRNVVAGNVRHGLMISGAVAGGAAAGNRVTSNRLVANGRNGVNVVGSRNQVIGGTAVDEENTIILNKADGVFVGQLSGNVFVVGNRIGTDIDGNDGGNLGDGVEVNNSLGTVIDSNSLHFNDGNGLRIVNVRGTLGQQTLVATNSILDNDTNGIQISNSTGTLVGGETNGNVIGLNARAGVRINLASRGNLIEANTIGTDESGSDLGNGEDGVFIAGSFGNVVRLANTISFNNIGVRILDADAGSLVAGNRVETNLLTLNDAEGVVVAGGSYHTIGGVNLGNVITLNGGDGVAVRTSGRNVPIGNLVQGNLIGTDPSQAPLGNAGSGVRIIGGSSNVVEQNTISDNGGSGITVAASSMNVIGSTVVGKGNQLIGNGAGIDVTDVIGKATATTRGNQITGNTVRHSAGNGVTVSGAKTVETVVGMTSAAGVLAGLGNTIRDNAGVGISLQNGVQQASMQGNSVVDNAGGAILQAAGTNVGAATPSIASVQLFNPSQSVAQVAVAGTLAGVVSGQQYFIDVYANRPEDSNGAAYGGRIWLGRQTITATVSGTMSYSIQVPAGTARLGDAVTVIATTQRPPATTSSAFSGGVSLVLASPAVSNATLAATGLASPPSANSTSARSRVSP